MKISILGTGMVGRTLAAGLAQAGHAVTVGTRDVQATRERGEAFPDTARLAAYPDAVADADLVINATNGQASLLALQAVGMDALAGKVLLDVANPLDFTSGFPPTLFTAQTDSLAEQIQRTFPATRVVKSLNTLNAGLMLDPGSLSAPSAVFLSGDDLVAKQQVRDLLTSFGWEQIIDLGGISSARGAEMLMPMWLNLMAVFEGPDFNWSIVR